MNQPSTSITPNPYDVLEVSPEASNKEITVAFTMAMKRRKYPVEAIAIARKSLMNPQERIIADYLRPILVKAQRFKRTDLSALNTPAPQLKFLAEFDGLKTAIKRGLGGFPAEPLAQIVVSDDWDAKRPQRLNQEAIAATDLVSPSDKQIGASLFADSPIQSAD